MFSVEPPKDDGLRNLDVKLARNVATLFGVPIAGSTSPTWVSELSRLTLIEVARGVATTVDTDRARRDANLGKKGAISPASFQSFEYDKLAGAVLMGANRLYQEMTDVMRDAWTHVESTVGKRDARIPDKLRIQTVAALVIEAYTVAPALFLAGIDARRTQREFFNQNRRLHMPDSPPAAAPARCEVNPAKAPHNDSDRRPRDRDANQFEFGIVDGIIAELMLEPNNGVVVTEAPAWSGFTGQVATELCRTIQQIGSPAGRGMLRVVDNDGQRQMEVSVLISYVAGAFGDRVSRLCRRPAPTEGRVGQSARATPSGMVGVLEALTPATTLKNLKEPKARRGAVLAMGWMILLYSKFGGANDEEEWPAIVAAATRLHGYVEGDEEFRQDQELRKRMELLALRLDLAHRRRAFRPFASGDGVAEVEDAANRLIKASAPGDQVRDALGNARYIDMLFDNSEVLNGIRRDLADVDGPDEQRFRRNLTDVITNNWDALDEVQREWTGITFEEAERRAAPVGSELDHLMHNLGTFLAYDENDPDRLERASNIFANIVLPARGYKANTPESASAVGQPNQLNYSLEAATVASASLARLYAEAGFTAMARKHQDLAHAYVTAIENMPAVIAKDQELKKSKPNHDDAVTAANRITGYLASPEPALRKVDELLNVAKRWTDECKHKDTALAHRFETLRRQRHGAGTSGTSRPLTRAVPSLPTNQRGPA